MIKIIRKDAENIIPLSNLKVGDTFRVSAPIYILIKKDIPKCLGFCLSTGKIETFYPEKNVVPVKATLICEDVTVKVNKEREELENYCKCSNCSQ